MGLLRRYRLGMVIGEKSRKLMVEQGKTQNELAEYCGILNVRLSDIFMGIIMPTPEVIRSIAEFFGVSVYELLGCEEPGKESTGSDGTDDDEDDTEE